MRVALFLFAAAMSLAADLTLPVPGPALSAGFSRDGKLAAAVCRDGAIRYWDVETGKLTRTVVLSRTKLRIATQSGDGTRAAAADESGAIRIWDLNNGELTRVLPPLNAGKYQKRLDALQFSPDSKRLAMAVRDRRVRIFDVESGRETLSVADGVGEDPMLAFSRDGSFIAAPNTDTNVRVWDARTGRQVALLDKLPMSVFTVAFSADGKFLAGAGVDRTIHIWNTATWKVERTLEGQPEMITAFALSPDGRKLVSGGFNQFTISKPVSVLVWDVGSGKVLKTLDAPYAVSGAAMSPDGKHAAGVTEGPVVRVWRID